jgi:hypothetical protein
MAPTDSGADYSYNGYSTPFATPEAQLADTERESDTVVAVSISTPAKAAQAGRSKGCIPRVDSLVLAEQRLAHCKRNARNVPDHLHHRPGSMFRQAITSIKSALHLSSSR